MTDDLNSILEITHPGDMPRPARRKPVCLGLSNGFALLTFLLAWKIASLEGEAVLGGLLIAVFGILPLQAASGILLVVALFRMERPWWAYLTVLSPLLAFAVWVIMNRGA